MEDVYLRLREINLNALKDRKERIAVFFDFDNTLYKGNMLEETLLFIFPSNKLVDLKDKVKKYNKISEIEKLLNQKIKSKSYFFREILKSKATSICDDWTKESNFLPKIKEALSKLTNQQLDLYLLSYSPVSYLNCLKKYFREIHGSEVEDGIVFYNKGDIIRKYANDYDLIFMVTDDFDLDYEVIFNSENLELILVKEAKGLPNLYRRSFYYVLECKDAFDVIKAIQTIYYVRKISGEDEEKIKTIHKLLKTYRNAKDCDSKIKVVLKLLEQRGIDYRELLENKVDEIIHSYFPEIFSL